MHFALNDCPTCLLKWNVSFCSRTTMNRRRSCTGVHLTSETATHWLPARNWRCDPQRGKKWIDGMDRWRGRKNGRNLPSVIHPHGSSYGSLHFLAAPVTNSWHPQFATSVRWSMSPTCLVDQHSALPDRTVCGFRRSNCQIGGRAFPVAAAQFWNSLPDNVTSASLLSAFRQQLKHTLFQQSFPDIIMWYFLTVTPVVA